MASFTRMALPSNSRTKLRYLWQANTIVRSLLGHVFRSIPRTGVGFRRADHDLLGCDHTSTRGRHHPNGRIEDKQQLSPLYKWIDLFRLRAESRLEVHSCLLSIKPPVSR